MTGDNPLRLKSTGYEHHLQDIFTAVAGLGTSVPWHLGLLTDSSPNCSEQGKSSQKKVDTEFYIGLNVEQANKRPTTERKKLFPGSSYCVCILVAQLCLILCGRMDCSPPVSSVHGILQARILERVV